MSKSIQDILAFGGEVEIKISIITQKDGTVVIFEIADPKNKTTLEMCSTNFNNDSLTLTGFMPIKDAKFYRKVGITLGSNKDDSKTS